MSVKIGNQEYFTVNEIAEAFGLQERVIRGYIASGRLTGAKMGKRYYVSDKAIEAYFAPEPEPLSAKEGEQLSLSLGKTEAQNG